jgi:hypothetical protein
LEETEYVKCKELEGCAFGMGGYKVGYVDGKVDKIRRYLARGKEAKYVK